MILLKLVTFVGVTILSLILHGVPNVNSDMSGMSTGNQSNQGMKHKKPVGKTREQLAETVRCTAQGRVAIMDECYHFAICESPGLPATVGKCPPKKVFHHQLRICLKIPYVECEHSMCQSNADRFPDPYSKLNYLTCAHMYPEVVPCPHEKLYDSKTEDCVSGSDLEGMTDSEEEDSTQQRNGSQKSWAQNVEEKAKSFEKGIKVNEAVAHEDKSKAANKKEV